MRKMRKLWILLLAVAMVITGIQSAPTAQVSAAKKKMKLSKKKLTLQVGKKKQLKVKNKKGKVKWTTSKKKVATVSKKGLVKAKKAGKATITATVKYKKKKTKLKCKVTVTKKKVKTTKKPVTPTPLKTQGSTTAAASKAPAVTSPQINPDNATAWDVNKQGSFYLSSIRFPDSSLTYQTEDDIVYLELGSKTSVQAAVPDLSKCMFEVYAGEKSYTSVTVGDIKWSSKSYHEGNIDHGYYEFKVYINEGGKSYYQSFKMVEKITTSVDDGTNFRITSIQSEQKELTPSKDPMDAAHYMLELPSAAASVKTLLPNLEKAKFSATYMEKDVVVEKIKNAQWFDESYYEDYPEGTGYYSFTLVAKNGAQLLEIPLILSDYNETLAIARYTYEQDGTQKVGTVMDYTAAITIAGQKGKSLKELYPNPGTQFAFTCLYRGKLYQNVKADNVKWVSTPYWENGCDSGYYTFSLTITGENGKTIKRDFKLVEEYRDITYKISGTLKSGSGAAAGGENLIFMLDEDDLSYETITKADGSYEIELPEGEYNILWNSARVDSVTVEQKAGTHNIQAENMFKYSGILTRLGKPWTDCDISFYGDERLIVHSDAKTGAYSIYLPANDWFAVWVDGFYMQALSTYNVQQDQNRNISCDYVKVSGTIYQSGTTPLPNNEFHVDADGQWEGDGRTFYTDENGNYRIYVNKNSDLVIRHENSRICIGEFSVEEEDVVKDMTVGVTHITGSVKAKNGDLLTNQEIIFVSGEGDDASEGWTVTDENGRYSMYLKPGTYSIKFLGDVILDQKLTVGAVGAVHNLEAPLYKISGTIKIGSTPWYNEDFYLCWDDIDPDEGYWMTTDDEGNYCTYMPAKNYTVVAVGYSKNSGVPLRVEGDTTKDLQFTMYTVKGHIYRAEGAEFEDDNDNISLNIVDPDGEVVKYLYPADQSDYEIHLERTGTYEVQCFMGWGYRTIDTFEVTGAELTHDIVCNLYRISGFVTGLADFQPKMLTFEFESGETISAETEQPKNGKMPYCIYLPEGTYNAYLLGEEDHKTEVRVTGDNPSLDLAAKAAYKVSGTLKRPSSGALGGKKISFHPQDITGQYRETTSAADGSYEVFLYPGTYTINIGNKLTMTIDVTDQDISQDIELDSIEISGSLKRNGTPIPWAHLEFRKKGEHPDSYMETFPISTDNLGNYTVYVTLSATYDIYYNNTLLDTITVTSDDVTGKDLTINMTSVSGTVSNPSGEEIANLNLAFYKKGSESSNANTFTDYNGNYSVYLTPGTYDIKYNDIVIREGLVVGEEDLTVDLTPALYSVNGMTSENNSEIYVFDSKKNCIFSFWCNLNTYSVYLPSGDYVFVLNNAETIGKEPDEIADEYKINVTVENEEVTQELNFGA